MRPTGPDPRQGAQTGLASRQTLPQVSQPPSASHWLAGFGGLGVVLALGLITFVTMRNARVEVVRAPAAAPAPSSPAPAMPVVFPASAVTTLPSAAAKPMPNAMLTTANNLASPGVVFDAGTGPSPATVSPAQATTGQQGAPNSNEDFATRATAAHGTAVASATFDPPTTITQGTLIPAILETAIDTDVPGYVRAIVSTDIRSFDGSRVLVPRSSRLIGQYKSGLQTGQRRIYVIWSRLIRPDGVSVDIGSPSTGFDGQSGLGGQVSTHFFERFGSAMLLSVISGLSAVSTGSTNIVIAGGGQSAATAAVGQTGQISPTIRVRPGEPIRVFTARDLDFSKAAPR
jgi:type IV secretion system protein VirB10